MPLTREGRGTGLAVAVDLINTWDELESEPDLIEGVDDVRVWLTWHGLDRAADELVIAARSVAERLEMRGDAFGFYLAGGAFQVVPWLVDELRKRLVEVAPRSHVERLTGEPATGAVWLALAEAAGGARVPRYKMTNG